MGLAITLLFPIKGDSERRESKSRFGERKRDIITNESFYKNRSNTIDIPTQQRYKARDTITRISLGEGLDRAQELVAAQKHELQTAQLKVFP